MNRRTSPFLALVLVVPGLALAQPAPLGPPPTPPAQTPEDDARTDDDATDRSQGVDAAATDPVPPPPPPPALDGAEPAPLRGVSATATDDPQVDARFEEAFRLVLDEDWSEAVPALREVLHRSRDPRTAGAAGALLRLSEHRLPAGQAINLLDTPQRGDGRFGFMAWTTVAGLAAGLELSGALELYNHGTPVPFASLTMLTTGAGFVGSLLLTRDLQISEGEALIYGYGLMTGTYDALLISLMARVDGQTVPALMLGGMALGGTAALVTGRGTRITPGDASLVGSGALWGTILSLLSLPIIQPSGDQAAEMIMLMGTNVGFFGAALATGSIDMSRNRVLLMDMGALLGGVGLGGIGLMLFFDSWDGPRLTSAFAATGVVAGAALSLYFTRDMDVVEGEGAQLGTLLQVDDGKIALGVPVPSVAPSPTDGGLPMVWTSLAAGRW